MADYFKKEEYRAGICHAVAETGKVLSANFPRKDDDTDELPNDVVED